MTDAVQLMYTYIKIAVDHNNYNNNNNNNNKIFYNLLMIKSAVSIY